MTVLVLRALGLGDFFTGLPALAMLRQALPGERIVLAVPDAYRPLALLAGSVDATVTGHELQPLVNPPRQPELAVDLHGNGPASRALLAVTEPGRLIAFGSASGASGSASGASGDGPRRDGPRWQAGEHEVARWCRLVREGLPAPGIADPPVAGALPVPPAALLQDPIPDDPIRQGDPVPAGRTVLHCGAKSASRRWPAERFSAVAAELRRAGHRVLVTGGPAEQRLARAIADRARVDAAGPMSLPRLLALVAAARLVVSGDTGVAHVATNYRTPSVVLFGPVSPASWGPPAADRHQVIWHGDGTGDPHGDRLDPALAAITVAEVLAACERCERAPAALARAGRA